VGYILSKKVLTENRGKSKILLTPMEGEKMAEKKGCLHFEKVKGSTDLANVAAHNSREKVMDESGGFKGDPPDWLVNPLKIDLNAGQMGKQSDSIGRRWARTVEDAHLVRKPQKNASRALEAVFTATAGSFESDSDWAAFLEKSREWAFRRFGEDNVLQWNTHFDETTPHLHILFAPIVRDPDKGNKYSSGEFLGGPDGLRDIQQKFYEDVCRPLGIDRGEVGSEKKHTNQKEWKSELAKKEKELEKKENSLKEWDDDIQKDMDYLRDREGDLDKRENELEKKEKELAEKNIEIMEDQKHVNDRLKKVIEREDAVATAEDSLKKKESELIKRDSAIQSTFKNLPVAQQYAAKLAEGLAGIINDDIPTAWKKFWNYVPDLWKKIKEEIREEKKTIQPVVEPEINIKISKGSHR